MPPLPHLRNIAFPLFMRHNLLKVGKWRDDEGYARYKMTIMKQIKCENRKKWEWWALNIEKTSLKRIEALRIWFLNWNKDKFSRTRAPSVEHTGESEGCGLDKPEGSITHTVDDENCQEDGSSGWDWAKGTKQRKLYMNWRQWTNWVPPIDVVLLQPE